MKNLLELNWKNHSILQESAVSTHLQSWLMHPGSFMQRLSEKGVHDPQVHVLLQAWQAAEPWESDVLPISPQAEALVREVLILSEGKCWMFARSIFPRQTLTGEEAALAHLQTRPLGSFLFNHPEMKRSDYSFASLSSGMRWREKVKQRIHAFVHLDDQQEMWSRYSLFHLQEKSLLLTEVFLSDIAEL